MAYPASEAELGLFSDEFRTAYTQIMHDEFPTQSASDQLSVFRRLIAHMTSGLGILKSSTDKRDETIMKLQGEMITMQSRPGGCQRKGSILDNKAISRASGPVGGSHTATKWPRALATQAMRGQAVMNHNLG